MPHVNHDNQYNFSGLKHLTCPHCERENSEEKFYHDHESFHDGDDLEAVVKCDNCNKNFVATMDKYNQCLGYSTAPVKCKEKNHKFSFKKVYESEDGTRYNVYACDLCWESEYKKLKPSGKEFTEEELRSEYRKKEPVNQAPVDPKDGEIFVQDDRISVNTKNAEGNRELYLQTLKKLKQLGFKISDVPRMKEQYETLTYYYAYGIWKELELEIHYYPAGMSLEFYQNSYPGERGPGQGRYEFNKKSLMPYMLQQRLKYVLNQVSDFWMQLPKPFNLKMNQKPEMGWHNVPNIEGLSFELASERIKKYPKDLSKESSCNLVDAHKKVMTNGEEKYFYNYDGVLMRGQVYYDLNNRWRVLASGKVWHVSSFDLFDYEPGLAVKKSRKNPKEKLDKQMKLAIEKQDFERCIVLREKIKQLSK